MKPDKKAKPDTAQQDTAKHPVVVILPGGDELTLHNGVTFAVYDGVLEVYGEDEQPIGAFAQWVGVYK